MWYKKFCKYWLCFSLLWLILMSLLTLWIDPYFHYGLPKNYLYYPLDNQRSQNDGILKHFKYDAIITGTSMTENFKSSELDRLFNVRSVKVPYSGGTYKEINDAISTAFRFGHPVKIVVRSLDGGHLIESSTALRLDLGEYPFYLYDDVILNDYQYLWCRGTFKVLMQTFRKRSGGITSFDEYSNWMKYCKFGKEYAIGRKTILHSPQCSRSLTPDDIKMLRGNVEQNILRLAQENPNTTFYYFFPPYSIVWWAEQYEQGNLERYLEAEKQAVDMITECDNIKLFSFYQMHDIVNNYDNYKDSTHYGEWINSRMLNHMIIDEGRITRQNKDEYFEKQRNYYLHYDYFSIYKQ